MDTYLCINNKRIPCYLNKVDFNTDILACALVVKSGSLQDEIPGTAHILEHVMIENQVIKNWDWSTIDRRAHTDFYETTYFFKTNKNILNIGLEFIESIVEGLWLNEENFELVKKNIVDEYNSLIKRDEFSILNALLKNSAFENHIPIGTLKTIEEVSFKDIKSYYKKHYLSDNIFIVISGCVSLYELKKIVYKEINFIEEELSIKKITEELPKLVFQNDIYNVFPDNDNKILLFFNIDKNQNPIFNKTINQTTEEALLIECLQVILSEYTKEFTKCIKCNLVQVSFGYYLIKIVIIKKDNVYYTTNAIIEKIINLNVNTYFQTITEIIENVQIEREIGTNLGIILEEQINSILYCEKYDGKDECNSIFSVERIINRLDELLHSNHYRVII